MPEHTPFLFSKGLDLFLFVNFMSGFLKPHLGQQKPQEMTISWRNCLFLKRENACLLGVSQQINCLKMARETSGCFGMDRNGITSVLDAIFLPYDFRSQFLQKWHLSILFLVTQASAKHFISLIEFPGKLSQLSCLLYAFCPSPI